MPKFLFVALCLAWSGLNAQQPVSWQTLAGVRYDYIRKSGQMFWYGKPTFSPEVLALDGKSVTVTGYVLPVDLASNLYYLSANPFSSCFFCGGAGQESVIELRLKNPRDRYVMDERVTFTGILRLSTQELEVSYILDQASRTR
ncbi:MAG: DUF3299 domain-containing protein [Bacteroidia bacterium]|nr:DUF3299 domain-containing protein [Bacteroidia bacterium]